MLARIEERVYADYRQFYVADLGRWRARSPDVDTSGTEFWSNEAIARGLAVLPALLGVGTASYGTVAVLVEVMDERPSLDLAQFDRVVEASLNVASGSLLVIGCTDPDGPIVHGLPLGWYRAMVCSKGLDRGVAAGEGGDSYALWFWPEPESRTEVTRAAVS